MMKDALVKTGMLWAVFLFFLVVRVTSEAPELAPDTCLLMDPFDSALPETSPCPFRLMISKTGVITNQDSIIFTIQASQPRLEFTRFIVQARDNQSGLAVGMFVDTGDADITLVNCFGRKENTAIEFDTEPKREARMRWMPEFDYEGFVTFFATVVQHKEVYWLRQSADTLKVYNPW